MLKSCAGRPFISLSCAGGTGAGAQVCGAIRNDYAPSASCAVLIDADSGEVLYEKNPDTRRPMASTAKVMTALVALENYDPDEIATVSKRAAYQEGSSVYLTEGERISVNELLYALLLESGNDAAVALAEHCGSYDLFVEMMNEKAVLLGLSNTFYSNPTGLDDPSGCTTALDLARLLAHAMKNAGFAKISGTRKIGFGGRVFVNHNKLLWYYEGVDGGKTGYTRLAGRTLVTTACRNNRRLVAATLNDPCDWSDHINMYSSEFDKA